MNKVYLIGNLTRDPEISTTTSGISVCRMSIAVGRRFANAEGGRETDFFNVTAWRGTADNCAKFLKKGNKIAVSGSIQTRNYEKADGTKGFSVDIVADEVEFLSSVVKISDHVEKGPESKDVAKVVGQVLANDIKKNKTLKPEKKKKEKK